MFDPFVIFIFALWPLILTELILSRVGKGVEETILWQIYIKALPGLNNFK